MVVTFFLGRCTLGALAFLGRCTLGIVLTFLGRSLDAAEEEDEREDDEEGDDREDDSSDLCPTQASTSVYNTQIGDHQK